MLNKLERFNISETMISFSPKLLTHCLGILLLCQAPSAYAQVEIGDTVQSPNYLTQRSIDSMKMKICMAMNQGKSDASISIPKKINSIIIAFSGLDPQSEDINEKIAKVWNRYSDQMICPTINGVYPTQHIYKRAIELKVEKGALVDYFLKDAGNFPINMNAVENKPDGTQETVLDYLDRILANPNVQNKYNAGQLIRVKKIIERRFDGKRAREL